MDYTGQSIVGQKLSKTGIPIQDLVVIAMKRFRASHGDYMGKTPLS